MEEREAVDDLTCHPKRYQDTSTFERSQDARANAFPNSGAESCGSFISRGMNPTYQSLHPSITSFKDADPCAVPVVKCILVQK